MRLPIKRKQSSQVLSLPDLAGGLNLRDSVSEVLDNQLTDCKNMWWNKGTLRTRPSFLQRQDSVTGACEPENCDIKKHKCYFSEKDKTGQLCSLVTAYKNKTEDAPFYETYINFFWVFEYYQKKLPPIYFKSNEPIDIKYFVCRQKDLLYCFMSLREIHKLDLSKASAKWEKVEEEEFYIPTVAIHCKSSHKLDSACSHEIGHEATMLDSYNILTPYYKMIYSAVNTSAEVTDNKYEMVYSLLEPINRSQNIGKKVKAKYIDRNGNEHKHEITLTEYKNDSNGNRIWWQWEENYGKDGLMMGVCGRQIRFNNASGTATLTKEDFVEDNLEFTVPLYRDNEDKEYDKIFKMTECEWFGGNASGLIGGTRLFLCGNKSEPSLVMWSGLNNPLYFPENSYFYVGDTSSAVTGFGKQSDMLVIFKENETWFTQYNQNTNITAQDLVNQSVVDFTASSVYFPVIQINSKIGCSYPNTIELCRNRLVWLGSDGEVYTLVSNSQYNERNIYCVSEMLNRQQHIADTYATACDWNGYYCLFIGGSMYLMDYNCYGFTHIASYSKTEDANIRIPWYIWSFSFGGEIFSLGDALLLAEYEKDSLRSSKINFYKAYSEDETPYDQFIASKGEIVSGFTTKVFDFGLPHYRKNIEKVNLQLGNNDGSEIKVSFITDNGTEETQVYTDGGYTQSYTAGFITSRAVFPCIKQVLRLGLKFESKGVLAVDSVIIQYKATGNAR